MKLQKAKHLKDELKKKNPNINHEYMYSEKIDGWYTYTDFDKYTGWSNIHSSSNRVIPSMVHCSEQYFSKLPNPSSNCRLIMEAYIPDTPFHILNGIFNRSKGNCLAEDVHFKLHDVIYLDDPLLDAYQRYRRLIELPDLERLQVHSLLGISSNQDKWQKAFETIVSNGGEGIVLKQADGTYQAGKRNSSLLKIKQEVSLKLRIIDYFTTIGAKGEVAYNLTVMRKGGASFNVVVPKHSDQAKFQEVCPIGQVAEIKAMKELENGMLREPVFKCIREDKNVWELVD